jgi:diaminopimelate epimerase
MKIEVFKTDACGNTFSVIPFFEKNLIPKFNKQKFIISICKKLKTDGCVFLLADKTADFKWDFYNSDGSKAEMCGNASRAVTHLFSKKIKKKQKITFRSQLGLVQANLSDERNPKVKMPYSVKLIKTTDLFAKINSGVPHCVVWAKPDKKMAAKLRKTENANVTFISVRGKKVFAVTFERGVEDFTQACGTGAIAAAFACKLKNPQKRKIKIQMPGGNLAVHFTGKGDIPVLKGPARIVKSLNYGFK